MQHKLQEEVVLSLKIKPINLIALPLSTLEPFSLSSIFFLFKLKEKDRLALAKPMLSTPKKRIKSNKLDEVS